MDRKWIDLFGPYAQKYAIKYGYHVCSPALAQFIQESSGNYDGLSLLAYKYNNFHGIKDYPKWTGLTINMKTGEEYTKGNITTINSNFCHFETQEQGWEQYFLFLERNPRYKNLKSCLTAEDYIQKIKADGYCTSSDYVNKCIKHLSTYNLKFYDNFIIAETDKTKYYCPSTTYITDANLYIREEPNGQKIKFDCITPNAKENAHFDDMGYAILNKGTKVTCKEVVAVDNSVWIRIPSGYICAINGSRVYVSYLGE